VIYDVFVHCVSHFGTDFCNNVDIALILVILCNKVEESPRKLKKNGAGELSRKLKSMKEWRRGRRWREIWCGKEPTRR
jgi:hypothetical protein